MTHRLLTALPFLAPLLALALVATVQSWRIRRNAKPCPECKHRAVEVVELRSRCEWLESAHAEMVRQSQPRVSSRAVRAAEARFGVAVLDDYRRGPRSPSGTAA